jgi:anti-sigma B factor antagonist
MTDSAPIPELLTTARAEAGVLVLATIHGEVDLHNSPSLRKLLLDSLKRWQPKKLILNMAKVPYVDSSAIAVLVEALKELRRTQGRVMLIELQPRVKGLLEIARLDSIFVIVKDEREALEL